MIEANEEYKKQTSIFNDDTIFVEESAINGSTLKYASIDNIIKNQILINFVF